MNFHWAAVTFWRFDALRCLQRRIAVSSQIGVSPQVSQGEAAMSALASGSRRWQMVRWVVDAGRHVRGQKRALSCW